MKAWRAGRTQQPPFGRALPARSTTARTTMAVLDMAEAMENAAALRAASVARGVDLSWSLSTGDVDEAGEGEGLDLRTQINIDMPCAFAMDCMMNLRPGPGWRPTH